MSCLGLEALQPDVTDGRDENQTSEKPSFASSVLFVLALKFGDEMSAKLEGGTVNSRQDRRGPITRY